MSLVAREITLKGSMVYNRRQGRADFEIAHDLLVRHHEALAATVVAG